MDGEIDFGKSPSGANVFVGDETNLNIFQETSESPEMCLLFNQQYQQHVNSTLCRLQCILDNNLEEQRKIIESQSYLEKKNLVYKTNRKPITLFAAPYFRDSRGCVAPENDDAILKRKRNDVDAYLLPPRPWTVEEHGLLAKAVYDNALSLHMQPLLLKETFLRGKLRKGNATEEEELEMNRTIAEMKNEIQMLHDKPKGLLVLDLKEELDWLQISTINMAGTRSPEECEGMWINFLHPRVNRKKFTSEEDKLLKKIADHRGGKNWDLIAKELGRNRTPIQCLERYQSHLNKEMLKKYWTPEEDAQLMSVVEACRVGDYIPWHRVAYYMSGRTRVQILNRWNRSIKPESRTGVWSKEEDAILYAAARKYYGEWMKISELLPGRTNYSCRERYINCLAPDLVTGEWTLEEDRMLIKLVVQYGEGKWSKISKHFKSRTDNACYQRLATMKRQNAKLYHSHLAQCRAGDAVETFMQAQIAKSKRCPIFNMKRQHLRQQAIETFNKAMSKISGLECEEQLPTSLDEQICVSVQALKQVSEALLSKEVSLKNVRSTPCYEPLQRHLKREQIENEHLNEKRGGRKRALSTSAEEETDEEEEVEIEEVHHSSDEHVQTDEEEELNEDLDMLFMPRVAAGFNKIRRTYVAKTSKEILEYDVLKHTVFEAFDVTDREVPEISVRQDIDYSLSIPRVLDLFIFPPRGNGALPVAPPNVSNMSAMLIFLVTRKLLEKSAQCEVSSNALENFKAITADWPNVNRRCQLCRTMLDQTQPNSAGTANKCECELIRKLRQQYITLRERFLSTFLWPALLSTIPMSDEQIRQLIVSDPHTPNKERKKVTRKPKKLPCLGRKKRRRRTHLEDSAD